MLKDPLTEWEDGFPYDLLVPAGITPESSMQEIQDASFTLLEQGAMTPQVRKAWDALRHPDRRLVVDFFMIQGEFDYPTIEGRVEEQGETDVGG
jgi:hypothetical protein